MATTAQPAAGVRPALIRLVAQYPDWTIRRYAQVLGVSPSRIQQLLARLGYRRQWVAGPVGRP